MKKLIYVVITIVLILTLLAAVSFTASAQSYNVTFNANGGSVSVSGKAVASGGTYGALPEPDYIGYIFTSWNTQQDGSGTTINENTTVNITSDIALYAQWKPVGDANSDGLLSIKDILRLKRVLAGSAAQTDGSDVSGDGSVDAADIICLQKLLIIGVNNMPTYTVTFKDYNGTTLSTQIVLSGFAAKKPSDPTRDEYVFDKWDKTFNSITSNVIVTATYKKITTGSGGPVASNSGGDIYTSWPGGFV